MYNTKLNRKDLTNIYNAARHAKIGYTCEYTAPDRHKLETVGYNSGVYGWNWTIYRDNETNTIYVSCYRNVPSYIVEK